MLYTNPVRACSFVPAATRIVSALGLEEQLVGVTSECKADKPRIVHSELDGRALASAEIDALVSASSASHQSLSIIDEELLERLAPDVVFTQGVCSVCQIDTASVERAIGRLGKRPRVVSLDPMRLEDVFQNILTIASALGEERRGEALLEELDDRLDAVQDALRSARAAVVRVCVLEWTEPLYSSGHWIPDQVAFAGGVELLGVAGAKSKVVRWDEVCALNPDAVIVAPCGLTLERAHEEAMRLKSLAGYSTLRAAEAGRIFVLDPDLFTEPSTMLVEGVEVLAGVLHPKVFAPRSASAVLSLES